MNEKTYNILFVCTGNSARSIMAEGLMNVMGGGRFRAFSAGSAPVGEIHLQTLKLLRGLNIPTDGLRSKGWNEFAAPGAPDLDFVFTLCDQAAGEVCPVWPGQPLSAHWGVEDPAAAPGSERQFRNAMIILTRRIELFLSLPLATIDNLSLQNKLDEIGKQGATNDD